LNKVDPPIPQQPGQIVQPTEPINEYENILPSKNVPTEESTEKPPKIDLSVNSSISQTADLLRDINTIKDELCKLPLDTCENEFINNNVTPLLSVLTQLAAVSLSLSTSVYYLTISPIVHPKKSELKDTIHLVYNINDKCEDVYSVVKKRINTVISKK
jgi:hypothetical protein